MVDSDTGVDSTLDSDTGVDSGVDRSRVYSQLGCPPSTYKAKDYKKIAGWRDYSIGTWDYSLNMRKSKDDIQNILLLNQNKVPYAGDFCLAFKRYIFHTVSEKALELQSADI
jgi:hypothetical protein